MDWNINNDNWYGWYPIVGNLIINGIPHGITIGISISMGYLVCDTTSEQYESQLGWWHSQNNMEK